MQKFVCIVTRRAKNWCFDNGGDVQVCKEVLAEELAASERKRRDCSACFVVKNIGCIINNDLLWHIGLAFKKGLESNDNQVLYGIGVSIRPSCHPIALVYTLRLTDLTEIWYRSSLGPMEEKGVVRFKSDYPRGRGKKNVVNLQMTLEWRKTRKSINFGKTVGTIG